MTLLEPHSELAIGRAACYVCPWMKPAQLDRLIVIGIGGALVAWTACLTILWGLAFDSSGASMLVTMAATMLAIALAAPLPGRAARVIQAFLVWRRPQDVLGIKLAFGAGMGTMLDEARAKVRMVCMSSVAAVACGLVSTAAILVGWALADALAGSFLWDPPAWWAVKFAVQLAGMLPMGFALSVAFLAGAILRSAGPDTYAPVCREWIWATAAGLGAFGACWWAGANLFAVSLVTAFGLLAGGVAILLRRKPTIRPRRAAQPVERPSATLFLGVGSGFAVLTLAMLVQVRLLGDLGGFGMPVRAGWAAASFAMVAAFLSREDGRSRPLGRGQSIGSAIGVAAGLLMQGSLAVTCVASWPGGAVCGVLAVGAQVPLSALSAVVISRQRRLFAKGGGRARHYLAAAAGGACLAFLAYLAVCSVRGAWVAILTVVIAMFAGSAVWAIRRAKQRPGVLQWAAWSTVLMLSAMGAVGASLRGFAESVGAVTPGVWLSSVSGWEGQAQARQDGCLPPVSAWRSGTITKTALRIMSCRPGRWWIVGATGGEIPSSRIPHTVHWSAAFPDPAAIPRAVWDDIRPGRHGGDFFHAIRTGREGFDGVYLCSLPADHPDAWRCYNDQSLRRCMETVRGGVFLLRTQADRRNIGAALAVAKTFHEILGTGWAAAELGEGRLDLLLVAGPGDLREHLPRSEGAFVVPIERLWLDWDEIPLIRLVSVPSDWEKGHPRAKQFQEWLKSVRE